MPTMPTVTAKLTAQIPPRPLSGRYGAELAGALELA